MDANGIQNSPLLLVVAVISNQEFCLNEISFLAISKKDRSLSLTISCIASCTTATRGSLYYAVFPYARTLCYCTVAPATRHKCSSSAVQRFHGSDDVWIMTSNPDKRHRRVLV